MTRKLSVLTDLKLRAVVRRTSGCQRDLRRMFYDVLLHRRSAGICGASELFRCALATAIEEVRSAAKWATESFSRLGE